MTIRRVHLFVVSSLLTTGLHAQGVPDDSAATRWIHAAIKIWAQLNTDSLRVGDTVLVAYKVQNVASHSIEICLGQSHGADLVVGQDTLHPFLFELVDHESCMQRDRLRPGQFVVWRATLGVPALSARGRATLLLWLDAVDPSDCQVFGCARALIHTQPLKVTLVGM